MDYESAWSDTKTWLNKGIEYLEGRLKECSQEEHDRLRFKLNGLKTVRQHMCQSEQIYKD